jgi:hypothetical protein
MAFTSACLFLSFSLLIQLCTSIALPFDQWSHGRVQLNDVSIHFRYAGSGPPLLLVHGNPQHSVCAWSKYNLVFSHSRNFLALLALGWSCSRRNVYCHCTRQPWDGRLFHTGKWQLHISGNGVGSQERPGLFTYQRNHDILT